MRRSLGIIVAVLLHIGFILFGGLLFFHDDNDKGTLQQVELLSAEDAAEKKDEKKPDEDTTPKDEEMKAEDEQPPDSAEILRSLEIMPASDAPALEAASLAAIEQALSGVGGGGDFSDALSFSSGGRIGGTGKAGELDDDLESAFSLSEIDQKPRPVLQSAPLYPAEMRGKKLEAVVTVIFVVEATGKVAEPRVEKSTHSAFDKPALDAVKQWKFEPAVKAGQRVPCKMRVPIRFQPS
jgi:protein TonB